MPDKAQSLIDLLILWGSLFFTWTAGELGRVLTAGAFGGFFRFTFSHQKRLRDGLLAVVTGAIAARYLGNVVEAIIVSVIPGVAVGPDLTLTAGFAAGIGGMTLSKIILGIFDMTARKFAMEKQDD